MTVTKRRAVRVGLLLALAVGANLFAVSAPALADVRTGSATDPIGDIPGVPPNQDLTAAEVSYDTAGTVTAKVTMAAAPSDADPALVRLILGRFDGADCRNVLYITATAPRGPAESTTDVGGLFNPPTLSQTGSVLTVQATDTRFANLPFECVDVVGGDPPTLLQDDIPNVRLTGAAPPPPPPPPPPPAAPALTAAKLSPASLTAARSGSPFTRRGKGRLTFTLSAAATVNVTLERRSGRRWRAVKGSVSLNLPAGANTLRFTGRWRGKRLARGRYRLVLAPSGPSGAGQVVRVAFRIRR